MKLSLTRGKSSEQEVTKEVVFSFGLLRCVDPMFELGINFEENVNMKVEAQRVEAGGWIRGRRHRCWIAVRIGPHEGFYLQN